MYAALKLLVYEAFSYWCMRPYATSVCSLKLLPYLAGLVLRTSACGLKLLVYAALKLLVYAALKLLVYEALSY